MRFLRAFLSSIVVLSLSWSWASGTSVRGGGDDVGLEFQSAFMFALQDIRLNHQDLYSQIAPSGVYQVALQTKIFVFDGPLFLDDTTQDQNVVALNDPSNYSIALSRPRWEQILDKNVQRGVALHEVLSLVGLEGSGRYPYSATYLNILRAQEKMPGVQSWAAFDIGSDGPRKIDCVMVTAKVSENHTLQGASRDFGIQLKCGGNFVSVNHLKYNKLTAKLVREALDTGALWSYEVTSIKFGAILKINGVDVNFTDESSVPNYVLPGKKYLNPGQNIRISGSAITDLLVTHLETLSAVGYLFAADKLHSALLIGGESGQGLLHYSSGGKGYNITLSGNLALTVMSSLRKAGIPFTDFIRERPGQTDHISRLSLQRSYREIGDICESIFNVESGLSTHTCYLEVDTLSFL
ncbi:hypothetical protein AZI86_06425 [Bdellovibrio bacteriovorus]|uniref:Bdellovibrio beta-sandwich domain-containing protein n=2 Tax=Bdellovibrio bacteriovorus TaxID=959 RepID=A0A150WQT8_BDEBC|nr:hypothetical protein AZI86_06425 [Bdellovibrio bacteriovorus]